jgi:hypothetical protein
VSDTEHGQKQISNARLRFFKELGQCCLLVHIADNYNAGHQLTSASLGRLKRPTILERGGPMAFGGISVLFNKRSRKDQR